MRTLFTLLTLCCGLSLSAQFGVITNANFHETRSTFFDGRDGFDALELKNGWEVGLNYWFRLPQKRVEFMPTIYYASSKFNVSEDKSFTEAGFQFKVNVYPFDFGGDCDCPTFGKQGPQLQKGFFFQLSPGYALYMPDSSIEQFENKYSFTLGAGIGLDIGLSNLVTITPIAAIRYGLNPYLDSNSSDIIGEIVLYSPSLTTFQAGLQVSFRLDHRKY